MAPELTTLRPGALTLLGGLAAVYALGYPFRFDPRSQRSPRAGLVVVGAVAMAHPGVVIQVAACAGLVFVVAAGTFTCVDR